MKPKFKFVVNPAAGNGRTISIWQEFSKKQLPVLRDFSTEFSQQKGDAVEITQRALTEGYDAIVAVGGDGTINEVVNGFFRNGEAINPEAGLGVLSTGTGGDWMRGSQATKNVVAAFEQMQQASAKKCDVGLLKCQTRQGEQISRYFLNVADAGFGAVTADRVNQSQKKAGSLLTYLLVLLSTLFNYKNCPMQIRVDDGFEEAGIFNTIAIANGQYFGGGMWLAPKAKFDDGLFDVVIIGDVKRWEILANIFRLYNGTLARHPKVTVLKGKKITATSPQKVLIETDGEVPGVLPASFEIVPQALNII